MSRCREEFEKDWIIRNCQEIPIYDQELAYWMSEVQNEWEVWQKSWKVCSVNNIKLCEKFKEEARKIKDVDCSYITGVDDCIAIILDELKGNV